VVRYDNYIVLEIEPIPNTRTLGIIKRRNCADNCFVDAATFLVFANAGKLFFFKYGADHKSLWMVCFIIGNIFGASSIWFSMKIFTYLNPNVVLICTGIGTFILVQLKMMIFFNSRLSILQLVGLFIALVGMTLTVLCGKTTI